MPKEIYDRFVEFREIKESILLNSLRLVNSKTYHSFLISHNWNPLALSARQDIL